MKDELKDMKQNNKHASFQKNPREAEQKPSKQGSYITVKYI